MLPTTLTKHSLLKISTVVTLDLQFGGSSHPAAPQLQISTQIILCMIDKTSHAGLLIFVEFLYVHILLLQTFFTYSNTYT